MCDSHTCCVFMNVSFVQVLFCLYSCVCLWLRIQVPLRESPWTITGPASLAEQISPEHGCSMLLLVPLYRLAPLPHTPQDCGLCTLTPAPLYRLTLSGPLPHKPKGLGHRAWVDEDWFDDRSLFVRNNGSKYPFVDITWHDYAVFTLPDPSDLSDRSLTSWVSKLHVTSPRLVQMTSPWLTLWSRKLLNCETFICKRVE